VFNPLSQFFKSRVVLWCFTGHNLVKDEFPHLSSALFLKVMVPNTDAAIVFLAPSALFFAGWIAPRPTLAQSLAKPQMRTMSSAAMILFKSLIGMGLGSLAVGLLNDALSSQLGDEAIRYSLVIVTLVSIWGAMHNLISARTLHEDLKAQTS
jgi:hypothetical protein